MNEDSEERLRTELEQRYPDPGQRILRRETRRLATNSTIVVSIVAYSGPSEIAGWTILLKRSRHARVEPSTSS